MRNRGQGYFRCSPFRSAGPCAPCLRHSCILDDEINKFGCCGIKFRCFESCVAQALSRPNHGDLLPPTGHYQCCTQRKPGFAQLRIPPGSSNACWKGLERSPGPPPANEQVEAQRGDFKRRVHWPPLSVRLFIHSINIHRVPTPCQRLL